MPRGRRGNQEGETRAPVRVHPLDQDESELIPQPVTPEMAWEYGVELAEAPEEVLTADQLDSAEALYMRDIRRYNLLTAAEEVALAETREMGEAAASRLKLLPRKDARRAELTAIVTRALSEASARGFSAADVRRELQSIVKGASS